MSRHNDELDAFCYAAKALARVMNEKPMDSCEGCAHDLGGGCCRINLEAECREGGGFEMWEHKEPEKLREAEQLPEESWKRPKLSKGDAVLKWAAILITAIAYPVVLYKLWMLWQ